MIKRVVALLIVLAFSIENFAAVVGDNDGAAFITKAEFDSLKSSFQEQINKYNKSIDNKIDGAIASYLAGINLQKKRNIPLTYNANWLWTSNATYSYDNANNKKFWFSCHFYARTAAYGNGYTAHWKWEKESRTEKTYSTLVYNDGDYYAANVLFRWEGILYFGRGGPAVDIGNDCGTVLWYRFWPDEMYEMQTVHQTLYQNNDWWYDGHNTLFVDIEKKNLNVIAPYSNVQTYYYLKGQQIQSIVDSGARYKLNGGPGTSGWSSNLEDWWAGSKFVAIEYYPDQLVSSQTNRYIATNDIVLNDLKQVNVNNDKLKYGVCIGSINDKIDDGGKISLQVKPSHQGLLEMAVGETASNAWDNGTTCAIYSTALSDITSFEKVEFELKTPKEELVFLRFKPDNDSVLANLELKDLIVTT